VGTIRNLHLIWFAIKAVRRPDELQNILEMAKILFSNGRLNELKEHCLHTAPQMLRLRPRFAPDLAKLAGMPPGTLGREYWEFLNTRKILPHDLKIPEGTYDLDQQFLFEYFYQTHDLFHLLTGFETDIQGELGLQAFYMGQAPTPLAPLLIGLGIVREFWVKPEGAPKLIRTIVAGYQLGRKAAPLYGVDWEKVLESPLSSIQQSLNLNGIEDIPKAA
jgi:ubiquinone biosynthesis protein COQ4